MSDWTWPNAEIVRVIDGDSFEARLQIDVGFYGTFTRVQKLRLAHVNAKPHGTRLGKEATEHVKRWATYKPITIVTMKPYKYGDEWMASVNHDGLDLAEDLVDRGLAVWWEGQGPRPD